MAVDTTSSSAMPHVLLFAVEAWGHTRPICNLAVLLVQKRRVNVTFLATPAMFDKVNGEISRSLASDASGRDRLRVVGVGSDGQIAIGGEPAFEKAYAKLAAREVLQCAVTSAAYTHLPAPSAVILDFIFLDGLRTIHKLTPHVKVFAWQTCTSTAILRKSGPEELGGEGDHFARLIKIANEHVITIGQAQLKASFPLAYASHKGNEAFGLLQHIAELPGNIVKVPGMPAQYDYEFHPYPMPPFMIEAIVRAESRCFPFLNECDGVIQTTDVSVEPEALKAFDGWMRKTGRKVYNIGPVLPKGETARASEVKQSPAGEAVTTYLEESLVNYGPNSVFYISFGSVWGPWDNPEKLWLLLETLIKNKVPFIFAHGSPMATIPEEIKLKVRGHGLLSSWAPQQTILDHPATGWFLTHGGQNSVMEALDAGIPMALWPFASDQPMNASHLTDDLQVSYQMFEVRALPHGLKKSLRTGRAYAGTNEAARAEFEELIRNMRGEDGARRRANAKKVQSVLRMSLKEGGKASLALEQLMDDLKL